MSEQIHIGAVLKHLRKARGLTQGDVGDRLGITYGAVGKQEQGNSNPSWSNIARFLDAIGADAWDLAETIDTLEGREPRYAATGANPVMMAKIEALGAEFNDRLDTLVAEAKLELQKAQRSPKG